MSPRHQPHRGAALVMALVALIILALLGSVLVRSAVAQRRHVQQAERAAQARWLVEAGLDRARYRLAADPDYTGELYEIPPDQLDHRGTAAVLIEVAAVAEQPNRRRVAVRAEFPRGDTFRARSRREVVIPTGPAPPGVPHP